MTTPVRSEPFEGSAVPARARSPRARGAAAKGVAKPHASDIVRRELVELDADGIQEHALHVVVSRFVHSAERLESCKRQRERGGLLSPSCPLVPPGPCAKHQCDDRRCYCRLSPEEFALEHGLGTPSLVRASRAPRRVICVLG